MCTEQGVNVKRSVRIILEATIYLDIFGKLMKSNKQKTPFHIRIRLVYHIISIDIKT